MNKHTSTLSTLIFFLGLMNTNAQRISEQFKAHWFDGHAEISSYALSQSRYGENREGFVVLIFVTEDFLKKEQVKANQKSKETEFNHLKFIFTEHLTIVWPSVSTGFP